MNIPLVSVLMAAYNSEKYIGEAIESVLASSFTDFELIVCDDRSTDATPDIAKSFEAKDKRVKVYINETNLGDYPNRNRAASYAKGIYLKYLDHDDIIYPWGLSVMVNCMEKYKEAGFGLMSYGLKQTGPYPILVSPLEAYRSYFFKVALIGMGPSGAIFKRDVFESVNGFTGKPFVGDSEMWLRLSKNNSLVRMPDDLIWYRTHEMQESKREQTDKMHAIRRFNILKDALTSIDCPLPDSERIIALKNYTSVSIRNCLIQNIPKLKFKAIMIHFKLSGFGFLDLIKSFSKNKKVAESVS